MDEVANQPPEWWHCQADSCPVVTGLVGYRIQYCFAFRHGEHKWFTRASRDTRPCANGRQQRLRFRPDLQVILSAVLSAREKSSIEACGCSRLVMPRHSTDSRVTANQCGSLLAAEAAPGTSRISGVMKTPAYGGGPVLSRANDIALQHTWGQHR
jgi:hypothetical protein